MNRFVKHWITRMLFFRNIFYNIITGWKTIGQLRRGINTRTTVMTTEFKIVDIFSTCFPTKRNRNTSIAIGFWFISLRNWEKLMNMLFFLRILLN